MINNDTLSMDNTGDIDTRCPASLEKYCLILLWRDSFEQMPWIVGLLQLHLTLGRKMTIHEDYV